MNQKSKALPYLAGAIVDTLTLAHIAVCTVSVSTHTILLLLLIYEAYVCWFVDFVKRCFLHLPYL